MRELSADGNGILLVIGSRTCKYCCTLASHFFILNHLSWPSAIRIVVQWLYNGCLLWFFWDLCCVGHWYCSEVISAWSEFWVGCMVDSIIWNGWGGCNCLWPEVFGFVWLAFYFFIRWRTYIFIFYN